MYPIRPHNRAVQLTLLAAFLCALPTPAQSPESQITLHSGQSRLSRLAPGITSGSRAFAVDECVGITVNIIATRPDLATSILAPGGEILDPTTVSNYGGTFASIPGAAGVESFLILPVSQPGHQYIYEFPALDIGTYAVRFEAAPGLAEEVAVITEVRTDSPLRVALFVTEPVIPTFYLSTAFSAAVFEGTQPVSGASVTVKIGRIDPPGATEATLALLDNGGPGDATPGDGLYSATFSSQYAGRFYAVGEISGLRSNGTPFERRASTAFRVVEGGAVMIRSHTTTTPVDTNGNGLYDHLRVTVAAVVFQTADYRLNVLMETASGRQLFGTGRANLVTGPVLRSISATISARDFIDAGENGPYRIRRLELSRVDPALGHVLQDREFFEPPLPTAAYELAQFERPAIEFIALASETGIDTDADGKFNLLRVLANVKVRTAGMFAFTCELADGCHRRIAYVTAQQALLADQVLPLTFDFDGSTIGSHGVAGPYHVQTMTIYRVGSQPSESLIVLTVGDTQPYLASQFEGYTGVGGDCNSNGQPDDCECLGDINGDQVVNLTDQSILLTAFGSCVGQPTYDARADFNGNGCVDLTDLACFLGRFGTSC
jgi:hypothetical protein